MEDNFLVLEKYGQSYAINFKIGKYAMMDNLYIGMITYDEEGNPEPWSNLTVNLMVKCVRNRAFIDINNNGEEILDWLKKNKLGTTTGRLQLSGFVIYPEFEFDMDKVRKYAIGATKGK